MAGSHTSINPDHLPKYFAPDIDSGIVGHKRDHLPTILKNLASIIAVESRRIWAFLKHPMETGFLTNRKILTQVKELNETKAPGTAAKVSNLLRQFESKLNLNSHRYAVNGSDEDIRKTIDELKQGSRPISPPMHEESFEDSTAAESEGASLEASSDREIAPDSLEDSSEVHQALSPEPIAEIPSLIPSEIEQHYSVYKEAVDQLKVWVATHAIESSMEEAIPLIAWAIAASGPLPIDEFLDVVLKEDLMGKTLLDYPETLEIILPILLDKLPLANFSKVIEKIEGAYLNYEPLTADVIGSLSKTQCLRFCASLKINSVPDGLKNKLPDFAQRYIGILAGRDIKETVHDIENSLGLTEEENHAAFANWIELLATPIDLLVEELGEEKILAVGLHLRNFNFMYFDNIPLAQQLILNCPNLYTLTTNNSQFLESMPVLSRCQELICNYCFTVSTLPQLPLCRSLFCSHCSTLTALPPLPLCRYLSCSYCSALTSLPPLPICQLLYCNHCSGLTELPALPECVCVFCEGCRSLTSFSALPRCAFLDYSGCTNNQEIPEVPFGCHVVSAPDPHSPASLYSVLKIDVERFSQEPEMLLLELGEHLLKGRPFPNVCYFERGQSSEAIDAGGVRRDFITRLCENLFKKDVDKTSFGKFLSLGPNSLPHPIEGTPREEEAYRTLGVIFALCYVGGANFTTGPLFDEKLYKCLTGPGDPGMGQAAPTEEWLLNSYLTLVHEKSYEKFKQLAGQGNELPELSKVELEAIAVLLDEDNPADINQAYFLDPANRERLRLALVKEAKEYYPHMKAISWIAQGMKSSVGQEVWDTLLAQGAKALKDRVEGIVSPEALKAKLRWHYSGNVHDPRFEKTKGYLQTWIDQNRSPERLSLFIRAVTGNKSLSAENLQVEVYNRGSGFIPCTHTCFYSIELSAEYENQDQFNEKLETLLTEGLAGMGFTFA